MGTVYTARFNDFYSVDPFFLFENFRFMLVKDFYELKISMSLRFL